MNQLDAGLALISDPHEKERVAELNLEAGRKAKASTAYASACKYLATAMDLAGPNSWEHRYDLMFDVWLERSECEYLSGNFDKANEAIRSARVNGFVHNEALANELAARFYAARGFEKIANLYLRDTRYCYHRWGAAGKVRQLEELFPRLREEVPVPALASTIGAPVEQLDLATVLKVSHAISSEIVLEKLINTLMGAALEHAGAERGLLVLPYGEEHRIAAEARTGPDEVEVELRQAPVSPACLPNSLLRYVIQIRESVILDDASVQNLFSDDEYFRRQGPRSVLCLPLVKQAELMGVLYLENNLAPRVFTARRLALLELLASHAAISLDHARLYADLIQENNDRSRAEEALRASEERWSMLAENSSAGIALLAPDGRFIAANLALQEMLGYTECELQRRTIFDVIYEQDRAATEARIAAAYEGERRVYRFEKRYVCKDGRLLWADVSSLFVPASGSNSAFFTAVIVDITKRKQAEENLFRCLKDQTKKRLKRSFDETRIVASHS